MTISLSLPDFANHLNDTFSVALEGEAIDFVLVEASRAGRHAPPEGMREPISLIFRGPPAPLLAQSMRCLEHPVLGRFELFLVPVGSKTEGFVYQSILA